MTFCCRMNSDTVDYDDACLIVRYLASMRPFAQSFDIYLTQVNWTRIPYTMILIFLILDTYGVVYDVYLLLRTDILKDHESIICFYLPYLIKCLCSTCLLYIDSSFIDKWIYICMNIYAYGIGRMML